MNDLLILDTDAASVLAKGELVDETLKAFSEVDIVITPKVEDELETPLDYGYRFPNRILKEKEIGTINIYREEKELYRNWSDQIMIGKGELESIAVAKNRGGTFFTMDKTAAKVAEKKDVDIIAFNTLMKKMLDEDVLKRKEAEKAVKRIEKKDNREIDKNKIFSK